MRTLIRFLLYALLPPAIAAGPGTPRLDPTRPISASGSSRLGSAAEPGVEPLEMRPGLVLVSPKRALALMNGQLLRPGERWGELRVARINQQGLWLRAADGSEILLRPSASDKRRTWPGPGPTLTGESR